MNEVQYFQYTGMDELETDTCYSYGDFERYQGKITEALTKSLFLRPDLMSGSDYSGGLITYSNYKAMIKEFKNVEGIYELYGGYNTYSIAIRLDVAQNNSEIKKILNGLEDYALIDEDLYSEIQTEWEIEGMKYVVDDLIDKIDLEAYLPDYATLLEDKEKFEQLIWDIINDHSIEWTIEIKSAYIDPDVLKPYVEDHYLLEYGKQDILPLLINREWACENNRKLYTEKLIA